MSKKTPADHTAAYRARQAESGARVVYVTVDARTAAALETIVECKGCNKRTAIQIALQRYANALQARRGA
jgi:hypothetical protein